jgi:NAD(P)-dependent dehydrogenase (short-subunit alcohol dehydrogenase family)
MFAKRTGNIRLTNPSDLGVDVQLNLSGKVALVTGASGGLGGAIASALAAEEMVVALVGRDRDKLAAVSANVQKLSGVAPIVISADLTQSAAADECVAATIAAAGRLDLLVTCAGATKRGDFFALSDQDWSDGFALKFHGCVRTCRAAWPHLTAQHGAVINIVGVGSRTPSMDFLIGGSVNNALLNFTKGLAERGIADGVRVNAINPGYFRTDRTDKRIDGLAKAHGVSREQAESMLLTELDVQRFGRPEEVGRLTAFLASEHAAYIHGATLDIDGGVTRGL